MCDRCNGTHVVHNTAGSMAFINTCPECGPKSVEQLEAESRENKRRLQEARRLLGMEETA
ncbi:hypothetical protein [Bacillus niameyensis]|uniref:hypothetical protein n=1 Tax=Bacillus niameyensis TaxID=1522308 RepID=UPI00078315CF|nr:hypothetical protein [Bacillus niameyensis]